MNDIKLMGNVINSEEIKESRKGRKYVWFNLGVNASDNGNKKDIIHCCAFDSTADIFGNSRQVGCQLLLQGRLEVSKVIDKKKSNQRIYYSVIAQKIYPLDNASA